MIITTFHKIFSFHLVLIFCTFTWLVQLSRPLLMRTIEYLLHISREIRLSKLKLGWGNSTALPTWLPLLSHSSNQFSRSWLSGAVMPRIYIYIFFFLSFLVIIILNNSCMLIHEFNINVIIVGNGRSIILLIWLFLLGHWNSWDNKSSSLKGY